MNISTILLRKITHFLCLVSFFIPCYSQQISNELAEAFGDKIKITYELSGDFGEYFDVDLYSSIDTLKPLKNISGDVGEFITPGSSKEIIVNTKHEFPEFTGEVFFILRAKQIVPYVKILSSEKDMIFKRAKNYRLEFYGFKNIDGLDVKLYKDTTSIGSIQDNMQYVNRLGKSYFFDWKIPGKSDIKPEYKLEAISTSPLQISDPVLFTVKRKIPVVVKISSIIGLSALGYLGYKMAFKEENPNEPQPLPEPPLPSR